MATISKRLRGGRVRWLAQVRRVDTQHLSRTFDTRREAEEWARGEESRIDRGDRPTTDRRALLGDVAGLYLNSQEFSDLASETQRNRRRELEFWCSELGTSLRLSGLTATRIETATAALRSRPGVQSAATVRNYLAGLGALLEYARRTLRILDRSPLEAVRRPAPPSGRVEVLSDEEFHRLEAACRASLDDRLWPMVIVSLSSGLRKAELLALAWEHVNLGRGALYVPDGKGGLDRRAWISGRGVEELSAFAALRGVTPGETRGPVWGRRARFGEEIVRHYPRVAWERARAGAGLPGFDWHSLRHTAASWFASLGATERELELFLGHRSPRLQRTYVHLGQVIESDVAPLIVARILSR
jgi:integrase